MVENKIITIKYRLRGLERLARVIARDSHLAVIALRWKLGSFDDNPEVIHVEDIDLIINTER